MLLVLNVNNTNTVIALYSLTAEGQDLLAAHLPAEALTR